MDSEKIQVVARLIAEAPTVDMGGVSERDALFLARVLEEQGLLCSHHEEEWSAAYLGRDGSLNLIGTEGSREHAEETRDECARSEPGREFFLVQRPVHQWKRV